jgi:hypothetical protein
MDISGDPEAPSPKSTLQATETRRKIHANPSAGEVHHREQGLPWRSAEEQIRLTNEKARQDQAEKRRWGLAKQIQDGLVHTYGINYGIAELAALLKEGIALKASGARELSSTEVSYVQLLAASEKYELKQIVGLLDKFPKGRNVAKQKA